MESTTKPYCNWIALITFVCGILPFQLYSREGETPSEESKQENDSHKMWTVDRMIRSYEPMYVGYTFDDQDQPFLDFSLSVMFPMGGINPLSEALPSTRFPDGEGYCEYDLKWRPRFYFAFNGRAGQYISTRKSSPVVGKRFNPLFSLRWWGDGAKESGLQDYFEFAYGHESNGQNIGRALRSDEPDDGIDWGARFNSVVDGYRGIEKFPEQVARDEISRGWDYVGIKWSNSWLGGKQDQNMQFMYVGLKAFLKYGIMQDVREDYYSWEDDVDALNEFDGEILRSKVDGITIGYRFKLGKKEDRDNVILRNQLGWVGDFLLELKTGYHDPFERLTLRAEVGWKHITLWGRHGYNSDFVNYYREDSSFGIAVKIREY